MLVYLFTKVALFQRAMRGIGRVLRVCEKNPNMSEMLLRSQEGDRPLKLLYWGETRWNSKVESMERVFRLHGAINFVCWVDTTLSDVHGLFEARHVRLREFSGEPVYHEAFTTARASIAKRQQSGFLLSGAAAAGALLDSKKRSKFIRLTSGSSSAVAAPALFSTSQAEEFIVEFRSQYLCWKRFGLRGLPSEQQEVGTAEFSNFVILSL